MKCGIGFNRKYSLQEMVADRSRAMEAILLAGKHTRYPGQSRICLRDDVVFDCDGVHERCTMRMQKGIKIEAPHGFVAIENLDDL